MSPKDAPKKEAYAIATEVLLLALRRIAEWDLPETGEYWPNGSKVSFEWNYGSDGARDYMREVARQAVENAGAHLGAPEPNKKKDPGRPSQEAAQGEHVAYISDADLERLRADRWATATVSAYKAAGAGGNNPLFAAQDQDTGTGEALLDFVRDIAAQTPEKPDYWSSCGQCAGNTSRADDLLDAHDPRRSTLPQPEGEKPA